MYILNTLEALGMKRKGEGEILQTIDTSIASADFRHKIRC